jgi:NHS family xanthosine MFS transporter
MGIKTRLTILSFLQFFIWGSWLISTGDYFYSKLNFPPQDIGLLFMTLGIASLLMPALVGIIVDKWVDAEKVLSLCFLMCGISLMIISFSNDNNFWYMFFAMLFQAASFMPTISLANSISYQLLEKNGIPTQSTFPKIRTWGTVGFIAAMFISDLTHFSISKNQFYLGAGVSLIMAIYAFFLPKCPPSNLSSNKSIVSRLGLDAFQLFRQQRMVLFFIFSLLLGAALQITNQWGMVFMRSFNSEFPDTFVVNHELIFLSFSQIAEALFILTIPFFLRRFGIKKVMMFSMLAWVLRFGLFGVGDPGEGFVYLLFSNIVYGMAFDFFNISGSLFIERETPSSIRGSAQGLFMMMTNGIGAVIGSIGSGWVIKLCTDNNNYTDWTYVWNIFAAYALVILIFFALLFKYKHFPEEEMDALSTRH